MGMRLSTMLANTTTTVVKFDGEEVLVCYRPNAVTLDLTDQLDAEAKAAEDAEKNGEQTKHDWVTAQLLPLIEWWDVLDEKDKRIPPTLDNMRKLPLKFLMAVLTAVTDDQKVEPGEDEGSDGGS